jgi:serine/threonine protein kinase
MQHMNTSFQPLGIGVGTLINSRYELVSKLGSGAMSAVFRVADRALNNDTIALKLFAPGINTDATLVERIRTEVLITRKLSHANIIRTYDFGRTKEGLYFMTMEYIEGVTLDRLIHGDALERPSFADIVRILRDIAAGISFAHQHEVIHRDLKPANIMIGANGSIKIADFGLARALTISKDLTQVGECVGTPYYMAPEQIQNQELDGRTDIYALGIIAYELMAGAVPFHDHNWFDLAKMIITRPLPEFERSMRVPPWYADFTRTAAAKSAAQRYQSAAEVVELLDSKLSSGEAVAGLSTDAKLPKVLSTFGRAFTAHRHQRAVSLPALSATHVLLFGLTLLSFLVLYTLMQNPESNVNQNLNKGAEAVNGMADTMNKMTQFVNFMVQNKDKIDALSKQLETSGKTPPADDPAAAGNTAKPDGHDVRNSDSTAGSAK